MTELSFEEILDELDPDWSSRWRGDSEEAAKFYRTYNPEAWYEAVRRLSNE